MSRFLKGIRILFLVTLLFNSIYLYTRIVYERGRVNFQMEQTTNNAESIKTIKNTRDREAGERFMENMQYAESVEAEILSDNNFKMELSFYGLVVNIIVLSYLLFRYRAQ